MAGSGGVNIVRENQAREAEWLHPLKTLNIMARELVNLVRTTVRNDWLGPIFAPERPCGAAEFLSRDAGPSVRLFSQKRRNSFFLVWGVLFI